LTVIHKNQLRARNVSKVALRKSSIQKLGKIKLSSKPPAAMRSSQKMSIQKLDKNKVFLHRQEGAAPYKSKEKAASSRIKRKDSSIRSPETKISPKERNIKPIDNRKISREKSKKSGSILGNIYSSVAGKKSKSVKRRSTESSSKGKSSSRASSSSRSKSSSSQKSGRTKSSSRSSSRTKSSSSKVKKK
jgi:hypothetical protein